MTYHDSIHHADDDSRPAREHFTGAEASDGPYKDARSFLDADGLRWYVHEVSAQGLGNAEASLLVVSANQVRRVAPIPDNWRALSPAALLALPSASL